MTEVLQMGWPFAVVCIALIIGAVVVYGIRQAVKTDQRPSPAFTTARIEDARD